MVTSDDNEMRLREICQDQTNSRYSGYYKFRDFDYLLSLLGEISPQFDIKGEPVSLENSTKIKEFFIDDVHYID